MKIELSSMVDNELDTDDQHALLVVLHSDGNMRASWDSYMLLGDALRGSPELATDLTASVMNALRNEATILAVPKRQAAGGFRSVAALAASLAGVAFVGWLALSPPTSQVSMAPSAKTPSPPIASTSARMQEYLMAHQAYSPSSRIQGGASYIRTVSSSR
ncbi:MAG: sigma-E factor negative regulatory protein [Sterolibacterium sp.]|jgi:sigma-E factor negative regulatory protein RseA